METEFIGHRFSNDHPIQPIERDAAGVIRFKHNAIINFMLEAGRRGQRFDMNTIGVEVFELKPLTDEVLALIRARTCLIEHIAKLFMIPAHLLGCPQADEPTIIDQSAVRECNWLN
jgi:hypothetical protein